MTDLHLNHVTPADPDLPHQVYFGIKDGKNHVTCNCRRVRNHVRGNWHPNWIGQTNDLNHARELYNTPENHVLPFGEGDMAKW